MATIRITDINATGSTLFLDEESFLEELSEDKIELTHGGFTVFALIGIGIASAALGYQMGRNDRR
jgi:hypothetical protein